MGFLYEHAVSCRGVLVQTHTHDIVKCVLLRPEHSESAPGAKCLEVSVNTGRKKTFGKYNKGKHCD